MTFDPLMEKKIIEGEIDDEIFRFNFVPMVNNLKFCIEMIDLP